MDNMKTLGIGAAVFIGAWFASGIAWSLLSALTLGLDYQTERTIGPWVSLVGGIAAVMLWHRSRKAKDGQRRETR